MTPLGCALYPQMNPVSVANLKMKEPKTYENLVEKCSELKIELPRTLYFNKGL
jgi:hypothetical protein